MEGKMARKVTTDDIKQFNELYYKYKSFAEVARQTGWSAGTVSRYVDKNYQPIAAESMQHFSSDILPFNEDSVKNCLDIGIVCVLSNEEKTEIEQLWKELAV
jgi:hypothetical protein